ncbi:MAG: GGDEF domain-containing protein [Parasphingorhabdus sp.]
MFMMSLFAAVFLIVYIHDRTQKFAGWMAVAYCLGLVAYCLDISRTVDSTAMTMAMNTAFWCLSGAVIAAVCARCDRPFPKLHFAGLLCLGYVSNIYFTFMSHDLAMRSSMSNVVGGLMIALTIPMLYSRKRQKIDRAIFIVMTSIAVIMCVRPYISFAIFGPESGTQYLQSGYALILHLTSAFIALAGAMVMLLASGLDMMDRLHRLSRTDYLTGLRNRRGMEATFDRLELENNLDGSAVIAVDIDKFKALNDQYGHPVGDVILKRVADCLNQLIGEIGTVGRVGGEEFLVVLSSVHAQAAIHFSEQVRSAIALIQHPEIDPGESVTASFGVAIVEQGETSRSALHRADAALYAAKDGGRNRVETAVSAVEQKRAG